MVEEVKIRKRRTLEELSDVASIAVHFSNKVTNSNIPGGGVRLGAEDALELPFISARTLLAAGYPFDVEYTINNGLLNAALAIASGEDDMASYPVKEAQDVKAVVEQQMALLSQHHEVGLESLDPRQRQLLIPDSAQECGYISLTPLTSISLCKLVADKVRTHNEVCKEENKKGVSTFRYIPLATMGFGGAKFMNVGRLALSLRSVPVWIAPQRNHAIRVATAIHHQGIEIRLPKLVMLTFAGWAFEIQRLNDGRLPMNTETREYLDQFVRDITHSVKKQVMWATRQLRTNKDALPSAQPEFEVPLADTVPNDVAGLFEREQRDEMWHRSLAIMLSDAVKNYIGVTESGMIWQVDIETEIEERLFKSFVKELPL